jgi:elongation factor 2
MPKFRQIPEITRLMNDKQCIRNIGVVAHIDHGKTTMTDSLLVEAGLLPPQIAGSARALDYLEEEQRRGITIKTANLSFLHEMEGITYLINLIDTPGHVDFAGKVARALRAIDGVIVVVDAVEEIMAQTETVLRQTLDERVKPVLFINKVDRLLTELRLSPGEIQKKFARIISDFNNLIEIYSENDFRRAWKVHPEKGSVIFGSALHKWGFSLQVNERSEKEFTDRNIWETYEQRSPSELSKMIPLRTAILGAVVKNLPSPLESQKYRIPRIWNGKTNSEIGEAMTKCDGNGPLVMCVTAVQTVPNEGLVATGRVFAGSVKEGDHVFLLKAAKEDRVEKVSIYMSAFRESVDSISAGNIAAVTGLESARAGETIVDISHKESMLPFESIGHVSEPVMTLAVEPNNPKGLPRVLEALNELAIEDPELKVTVNKETGQYLLGGMGELHLEVAMNSLKRKLGDVELVATTPYATYREGILNKGAVVLTRSPNKLNRFIMQIEPLNDEMMEIVEKAFSGNEDDLKKRLGHITGQNVWAVDEHANILVSPTRNSEFPEDLKINIVQGFHWACKSGPLCQQPLRGIKVTLAEVGFDSNPNNRESSQVMHAVSRGVLGSFLTAKPVFMEAIYAIEVTSPVQLFGACTNLIIRRRGKIDSTDQKAGLAIVNGTIPVAETFGLATEMRSTSSGRALWQMSFARWEKMPEELATKIIKRFRERIGLSPEVPRPEIFVDEIRR